MRSVQREGGEEAEGAAEGTVCRRRSQLSAQKGEVVLNFICVVTLQSPSLSRLHTYALCPSLSTCVCVCVVAGVTGRWRGAQRVKRTLKPEIGSYSAWLFACLPLSLSLCLSTPSSAPLALPCFSSSLVLLLLLRHLLMSTCYCST